MSSSITTTTTASSPSTTATTTTTSPGVVGGISPTPSYGSDPTFDGAATGSSLNTLRSVFFFLGFLVIMIAAFYAIYLGRRSRHRFRHPEEDPEMAETGNGTRANSTWRPDAGDEGKGLIVLFSSGFGPDSVLPNPNKSRAMTSTVSPNVVTQRALTLIFFPFRLPASISSLHVGSSLR